MSASKDRKLTKTKRRKTGVPHLIFEGQKRKHGRSLRSMFGSLKAEFDAMPVKKTTQQLLDEIDDEEDP